MLHRRPPKPDAGFYHSWSAWAKVLTPYLQDLERSLDSPRSAVLQAYTATGLPSAAQAGVLIFISDEDKAAISTSTGGWKRLRFVT